MSTAITLEVPKEKWRGYFDVLSNEYQGWAISIEALDRELGDQPLANGLPLQGISYETTGSQAGDILIEAGDAGTPFHTHLVHRPRIVRIATTQPGADVDVEIESDDGVTTLVRLRPLPALPPAGSN